MADVSQTTAPDWPVILRAWAKWGLYGGEQPGASDYRKIANEIDRLRYRLAKIEHAPVPEDNEIAMTLKRWATPRDGEPANV